MRRRRRFFVAVSSSGKIVSTRTVRYN
jgi:hypothetical protein